MQYNPGMPRVIDYAEVLESLNRAGLVSLYHNSGAFGFAEEAPTQSVGWIVRDDSTIRPAARAICRLVSPPTERTLATFAGAIWADRLASESVWVMPMSHWAYELDFGSYQWLPTVLSEAGIDPIQLIGRHDGAAIEFLRAERPEFEKMIEHLLMHLAQSDFTFVFPGGATVCTVHHHKQLWWTTTDTAISDRLRQLPDGPP